MFKRMNGARAGNAAYDAYKTRAIAHAEQRRTKPGAAGEFLQTADMVFAAALAPDKPVLEDFVSGVPVEEANPVDSCEIKVAVALQGVAGGARRDAHRASGFARRSAIAPIFPILSSSRVLTRNRGRVRATLRLSRQIPPRRSPL